MLSLTVLVAREYTQNDIAKIGSVLELSVLFHIHEQESDSSSLQINRSVVRSITATLLMHCYK